MINKEERGTLIVSLVTAGKTKEEVIAEVVEKTGIKENTASRHIDELYPDGLPEVKDSSEDEVKTPEDESVKTDEDKVKGPTDEEETVKEPAATPTKEEEPKPAKAKKKKKAKTKKKDAGVTRHTGLLTTQEKAEPHKSKGRRDEYEVKEKETHCFHVELEKTYFNPTGDKTSVPEVQMFSKSEYETLLKTASSLGYTHVKVLHDPTK